jgi:hypothetical protein
MCSYPCFGLSKTGFTPPSPLLKLINFFLKKNRHCVAADHEIGSENCVTADHDAEIGSENCVAADAEIGSENCVIISYIYIYIYIYILLGVYIV